MRLVRALNAGMLLGLGASLAIAVPRLWSKAAQDQPRELPGATTGPPAPATAAPAPAPSGPALPPLAINSHLSQACFERLRHENLHRHGPVVLQVHLGISGRVKHLSLTSPARTPASLPRCVREEVARWTFPPSDEEQALELRVLPSRERPPAILGGSLAEVGECGTGAGQKRTQSRR